MLFMYVCVFQSFGKVLRWKQQTTKTRRYERGMSGIKREDIHTAASDVNIG